MKTTTLPGEKPIPGYQELEELALDLIWSWSHAGDVIWKSIDPILWEITYNPWVVLQTVSGSQLEHVLGDPKFKKQLGELLEKKRTLDTTPGWFQKTYPKSPLSCVAYFCMEYLLSEALPIYSGGLGNVAGDQLKAASDLGVPVIAIGLLYQQGYFRQIFNAEGEQQASYPFNSPEQLPIAPLRKPNGEWLRLKLTMPGWSLWLRTWEVKVGRTKLYLLDTNDAVNYPPLRGITSELYGGDSEMRLKQEIVLGMGGWMLLDALGIHPEVCHLNEGHAAFAILERAKCAMKTLGLPFHAALAATRAGNLFTTHTAVPAGFDRFASCLIERYLGDYAEKELGIGIQELLALGRQNPDNHNEPFNMAYLAFRGSSAVNAVSALHEKVSKRLFTPLFPRWTEGEIPVSHVTNGVHVPTWDSAQADALWSETCGKSRWLGPVDTLEKDFRCASDAKIWRMRNEARKDMINYGRERLSRLWQMRGFTLEEVELAKRIFNNNTLTLGFARRFATYKRPNLLLTDRERLKRILLNPERPVQLILAGKAHPADQPGQALIKEWIQFIKQPDVRQHIVFLADYDMLMTEHIVAGVDVWINTPRRPWEACGTSGMKVLANGGLNLSELDGWWAEAYCPEVGWALGDGEEHGNDPAWDAQEANQLYEILENEVVPEFYTRNVEGIPEAWVGRIRESMARLTPRFSAQRSVTEYTEKFYLPAAANYLSRSQDHGKKAKELAEWSRALSEKWPSLEFGEVHVETEGDHHQFEIQINLNGLDPNWIRIELCTIEACHFSMKRMKEQGEFTFFRGAVPANRPVSDYTPRVISQFPGAVIPLEAPFILWQR
jgi:starch phosphorylase